MDSILRNGDFGVFESVSLSVRNLRDLLAQAEANGGHGSLVRTLPNGGTLAVRVEPNAVHYGNREPGPGSHEGAARHRARVAIVAAEVDAMLREDALRFGPL